MNGLVLRKDGFYLREWNSEKGAYDPEQLLEDGKWLFRWTDALELEGRVTLGDVFAILAELSEGERQLFSALAEAGDIGAFIEEAQKPLTGEHSETNSLDYIEIYRFVEINWYKREGIPDFECRVLTSGCCKDDPQRYSFDFTPVNALLHCELRLLPTTRFYDNRNDYNEKGKFARPPHNPPFDKMSDDPDYDPNQYPTVNGKPCTCAECEGEHFTTSCKLGEVMLALFDDICFHGTPEMRDERLEDLIQTRDEVLSGKVEMVPLDENEDEE
jgi:hypothetical protein